MTIHTYDNSEYTNNNDNNKIWTCVPCGDVNIEVSTSQTSIVTPQGFPTRTPSKNMHQHILTQQDFINSVKEKLEEQYLVHISRGYTQRPVFLKQA